MSAYGTSYYGTATYGGSPDPPVIPSPPSPVQTQADAIADAIAGRYGPVLSHWRFERRTITNLFVEDVSDAFVEMRIKMDNDRAVHASASFLILPALAPNLEANDHVAVFEEFLVEGTWTRFQRGLFLLTQPKASQNANSVEMWSVAAGDVSVHLAMTRTEVPFTLPAGSNYLLAAKQLILAQGLLIASDWPSSADITPVAFSWKAQTVWATVINAILAAVNCYPCWANETGQMTTKLQSNPASETAVVSYSTGVAPLMAIWPSERTEDRTRAKNRWVIAQDDPLRSPWNVALQNNDPESDVSIQSIGGVNEGSTKDGLIVSKAVAADIAEYRLCREAASTVRRTLKTLPDPRRWAHEYIELSLDDYELHTLWRVMSWDLSKDEMSWELERAFALTVTSPFLVTPAVFVVNHGTAMNVTVQALKADGSVDAAYTGTVSFSSSDPGATLPGDHAFTVGDAGSHVFSVTLGTPGYQTITVEDASSTSHGVSQVVTVQ